MKIANIQRNGGLTKVAAVTAIVCAFLGFLYAALKPPLDLAIDSAFSAVAHEHFKNDPLVGDFSAGMGRTNK
jgi:hypothetical protein